MKYYIILVINILLSSYSLHPFQTLSDIVRYAKKIPEYPTALNNDWFDPNYTLFYKATTNSLFTQFLEDLGIYQVVGWNPQKFIDDLMLVTKERVSQQISKDTITHIHAKAGSTFIIWGDIHAAYHSLTYCLLDLQKLGIIDEQLHIIKSDCYFVFNGDLIDRSAYSMETLHIVLSLMKKNPKHIFYIRGKHESYEYWHNFGLKRELLIRAKELSQEAIPFSAEINTFFNTLPLALYISTGNQWHDVIRISHYDRSRIDEQWTNTFFTPSDQKIRHYSIQNRIASSVPVDVKAIIKTEDWMHNQISQTGLGMPAQDKGATSWTILSSPIPVHQIYNNFFYDAYVILTINDPIEQSLLTLRNQYIKERTGFINYATYNIITGSKQADHKKAVYIGSTMALFQGVPVMGRRIEQGISIVINSYNQDLDTPYYLRTFIYNDDYVPSIARANINQLLNQSIDLILLPIGSPTLQGYLDIIKEKKIAVFFPITGAMQFRKPDLENIIHLRASYADEVRALIKYFVTERGIKKFAFLYQDDDYGKDPLKIAHEELKKYGISDWHDVAYTRGSVNLKEQAIRMQQIQPEAIGFFSTSHPTLEFIRQIGIEYLSNQFLFGISFLGESSLRRFLQQSGLHMTFGAVVPNPFLSDLPIAQEYRNVMDKYHYLYDVYSFESYIATSLFLHACNTLPFPVTKEKLLTFFESLHNYNFKGLILNFNKNQRNFSLPAWIETNNHSPWLSHMTSS